MKSIHHIVGEDVQIFVIIKNQTISTFKIKKGKRNKIVRRRGKERKGKERRKEKNIPVRSPFTSTLVIVLLFRFTLKSPPEERPFTPASKVLAVKRYPPE